MYWYHSIQGLTTLDISTNAIDAKGAMYLADALKHNKVR
jgi:hypothetical protein